MGVRAEMSVELVTSLTGGVRKTRAGPIVSFAIEAVCSRTILESKNAYIYASVHPAICHHRLFHGSVIGVCR